MNGLSQRTSDVLVVGAGPTGLVLAIELLRRGSSVRIVERSAERSPNSRATDIHARSLEILDAMGVTEQILARGKQVRTFNAFSGGRRVCRLNLGCINSRFPFTVALPQGELNQMLETRVEQLGGRVERGVELVELTQRESGVDLLLRDCADRTQTRRSSARFVVGCDGVGSTVRSLTGSPFEGHTYASRYLVADVGLDWQLPHDEVHLFMTQGGFFNVVALPGKTQRCRILFDMDEGDAQAPSLELIASVLERRAQLPARLYEPTMLTTFRIQRRLVPNYRRGRVFYAGDAAHTCSPLLGQGMNLGIHDAWNLGWKLDLVCRGTAGRALLDSYATERRRVARAVLFHTDMIHRTSRVQNAWVAGARDRAATLVSRIEALGAVAANLCSGLGVSYPRSALVVEANSSATSKAHADLRSAMSLFAPWPRSGAPQPGERAPEGDATPSGLRFTKALGRPLHSLLVFLGANPAPEAEAALVRLNAQLRRAFGELVETLLIAPESATIDLPHCERLADPTLSLHDRYGARAGALCLVRPDGYVGYRGGLAGEPLLAHLDGLFASRPLAAAVSAWADQRLKRAT